MKKSLGVKPYLYPMPVLMVATAACSSGATIASSAVTGALNAAAYFVNNCIAQ